MIADSIELVCDAHQFDAVVAISGCDKTIPATVMALARLDIPSLMLYGGSILPGHYRGRQITIMDVFEAVGARAAGRITDQELLEIENSASPGAGACGGQYTANTMAMAFEVLGISPVGFSMIPAVRRPEVRRGREGRGARDGRAAPRRPPERRDHEGGTRKRDRLDRDERGFDQRRPASARGRFGDGDRAVDRRFRRDQQAHSVALRSGPIRALCGA